MTDEEKRGGGREKDKKKTVVRDRDEDHLRWLSRVWEEISRLPLAALVGQSPLKA